MGGYKAGWFNRSIAYTAAIYLILPIAVVLPLSFTDQAFLSFPKEHWSAQNYTKVLNDSAWTSAIGQSFGIAMLSTILAVTLGTLCALGCWRISSKATEAIRALMLLPIVIPSVVYAVGLYRYFANLGMLDTVTGVVIAHGITGLPYVVITVMSALATFDARLESAARGLGASLTQTLRLVIIPRIMPGIISGAVFAFLHSWDELVIVLFVSSRRVFTLPRKMWDGINDNMDPAMAAIAILLIATTVVLLTVNLRFSRKKGSSP
jgi:putative spermidine/putrescine transport system permease protein